jgi:hypothetical protein
MRVIGRHRAVHAVVVMCILLMESESAAFRIEGGLLYVAEWKEERLHEDIVEGGAELQQDELHGSGPAQIYLQSGGPVRICRASVRGVS